MVLSHTDIIYLPDELFSKLYALKELDLSDNNIKSIQDNQFSGNRNLKSLNMARNDIRHIGFNFGTLPYLILLELDGNINLNYLNGTAFNKYSRRANRKLSILQTNIACDCSLRWAFKSRVKLQLESEYCDRVRSLKYFNRKTVKCVIFGETICKDYIKIAKKYCKLGSTIYYIFVSD